MINLIDANLLIADEVDHRYINSPFMNLKLMHAKQKGSRYEMITECVLKKLGFDVKKPKSTEYDRIINNYRCEIKGSTLNKNTTNFSFLQIRPDQDYDKLVFSMFYPDELVIMEMDKEIILKNIASGVFKKQHGGNKAESRTYCYYGNKESLSSHGATVIGG